MSHPEDDRLHVQRSGSGPPLLLIQGMSGHSGHWGAELLDALAADFDVIAYDHRGTGGSGPPGEGFAMRDLAQDAARGRDEQGVTSAHVLGLSMGASVALELALARPERVRTLTLVGAMLGGADTIRPSAETLQKLGEALLSQDPDLLLRTGYEVNLSEGHRADPERWPSFRALVSDRPVAPEARIAFMQAIAAFDVTERAAEITAPTLVVHGTRDETVPIGNGEQVAAAIAGAQLERVEGAAHFLHLEQPEQLAMLIRAHARSSQSVAG